MIIIKAIMATKLVAMDGYCAQFNIYWEWLLPD